MASVVIDANLAIGLVRQMPFSDAFRRLIEGWIYNGTPMLVPGLWDYEVVSGLRRLWQQKALTEEQTFGGLEEILNLDIKRYPAEPKLMQSALRWAARLGQSKAYDAQYVALAEQFNAELWSADQRLVHALRDQGIPWAHWIGEM
jgi:predicted nucleic acid-binding protein